MAEVVETMHKTMVPSNAKVNGALTTGIIGTSLAGLMLLSGGNNGFLSGLFGGKTSNMSGLTNEDVYIERKQCQDFIDITKQYYEGQASLNRSLTDGFFAAYQRDVQNSFDLYKGQRDIKDDLLAKIESVDKKVDIMAAIRPYQDALINCKIDNNALIADFNLSRRTCRMIQGEVVLPSTPTVTGYASFYPCNCNNAPAGA
jgi:hypothetical protein